jgi:hypothetical protein
MSADVWIVRDRCNACGRGVAAALTRARLTLLATGDVDESLNITYNLTGMLTAAGFHGWKWCIGKTAREVGTHMLAVLDGMNTDPEKWRAMNPPNGWGDYDQCLQGRMRAWAEVAAASNNSGDQIGGWL